MDAHKKKYKFFTDNKYSSQHSVVWHFNKHCQCCIIAYYIT